MTALLLTPASKIFPLVEKQIALTISAAVKIYKT
jgi:hypothetical protein